MKKHGKGGANTNKSGLLNESKLDIRKTIESTNGYNIKNNVLYDSKGKEIGFFKSKYDFVKYLKEDLKLDFNDKVGFEIKPDDVFFKYGYSGGYISDIYIIEYKYQNTAGSVDEKIQTGPVKLKLFEELFSNIDPNPNIFYIYGLSDFFKRKKYNVILKTIKQMKCKVFFGFIDLKILGL